MSSGNPLYKHFYKLLQPCKRLLWRVQYGLFDQVAKTADSASQVNLPQDTVDLPTEEGTAHRKPNHHKQTYTLHQKEVLQRAIETLSSFRQQGYTHKDKQDNLQALDILLGQWFHPTLGSAMVIQSEELLGFVDGLLEFWPQDTALQERKCLAYWLAGMPQAAQNLAYTLIEQSPELPFCNYILAEMAFREGKHQALQAKLFFLEKVLHSRKRQGVSLPEAYAWIRRRVTCLKRDYYRLRMGHRLPGVSPFLQTPYHTQEARVSCVGQWLMAECVAMFQMLQVLCQEPEKLVLYYYQLWFRVMRMYQSIPKRIEYLQAWQKAYPNVVWLKTLLGTHYAKLGKTDAAILQWQSAVLLDPHDQPAWQALGEYYERLMLPQKCLMIYEKLASLYPKDPEVYCQIGNFCVDLKQYGRAYEMYQVAFRLGYDPQWQALVAVSLAQLGSLLPSRTEAAKAWYHIAIQLNPQAKEPYTQLGSLAFDTDEYKLSQTVCETARQVMPNDASMCANLGYLYWHEGRIPEAVRAYEEALTMNPLYEVAWNNLGVIMLDGVAHMPRAIHSLEMAVQLKSDYLLARFNLARAYHHINEDGKAAEQLVLVKQLNHIFKELQEEELQALWQQVFRHNQESDSLPERFPSDTTQPPEIPQDASAHLGNMLLLPERPHTPHQENPSKSPHKHHNHAVWHYPQQTFQEDSQPKASPPVDASVRIPNRSHNSDPALPAEHTKHSPLEYVIYVDPQGLAWQTPAIPPQETTDGTTTVFLTDTHAQQMLETIFIQYHHTQDEQALLYALGKWFQGLEGQVPEIFLPNSPLTLSSLQEISPPQEGVPVEDSSEQPSHFKPSTPPASSEDEKA